MTFAAGRQVQGACRESKSDEHSFARGAKQQGLQERNSCQRGKKQRLLHEPKAAQAGRGNIWLDEVHGPSAQEQILWQGAHGNGVFAVGGELQFGAYDGAVWLAN